MDAADFEQVYADNWRPVLAYAVRRVSERADAADVTAEVFTIAWRRRDDIPDGPDARLWLFGVARRVVANQLRGELRRARLAEALRCALHQAARDPADELLEREHAAAALAALRELPETERELLTLTAWEGLTPSQAARVLGLSPAAARVRLHRARKRLGGALTPKRRPPAPGSVLVDGNPPVPTEEAIC
jgi:RNA polymerase sigma-70 factor (ECF subfamily)